MLPTPTLRLAEITLIAILLATLLFAWRAERRDRAQLAVELATAKQALAAADSRQHDRDAQLVQTLSTLAAQKRAVNTPNKSSAPSHNKSRCQLRSRSRHRQTQPSLPAHASPMKIPFSPRM